MTPEEKAKAYDEAIDKVAHFIKKHIGFGCMIHPNSSEAKELFNIFPELAESEDERIRKELIDYHRSMAAQADDYVHEVWIAWLEKQGEKKSIDDLTPQEAMDIAVAKCFEQGEQKPAWSEEDEKKLLCICSWIKDYPRIADFKDEMYTVANNYIDWLNSLRPHKQWKPNEEQMDSLLFAEGFIRGHCAEEIAKELKSLYEQLKAL